MTNLVAKCWYVLGTACSQSRAVTVARRDQSVSLTALSRPEDVTCAQPLIKPGPSNKRRSCNIRLWQALLSIQPLVILLRSIAHVLCRKPNHSCGFSPLSLTTLRARLRRGRKTNSRPVIKLSATRARLQRGRKIDSSPKTSPALHNGLLLLAPVDPVG